MKKSLIAITTVFLLMIGAVFAYQNGMNTELRENNYNTYHDSMEKIVETGTYEDLQALREETGMQMARWIQNEEDFNDWKLMHEQNEELGLSGQGPKGQGNHMTRGQGIGQGGYGNSGQRGNGQGAYGSGQGYNGNCPMLD